MRKRPSEKGFSGHLGEDWDLLLHSKNESHCGSKWRANTMPRSTMVRPWPCRGSLDKRIPNRHGGGRTLDPPEITPKSKLELQQNRPRLLRPGDRKNFWRALRANSNADSR